MPVADTALPEMHHVASSNIEAVGWDSATRELHVRFKGGAHYVYAEVPELAFREMRAAASPGSFMHREIKPKYAHRRVA